MTMIAHGIAVLRACIAELRVEHAEDRVIEATNKQFSETEILKFKAKKESALDALDKAKKSFKRLIFAENRMSALWNDIVGYTNNEAYRHERYGQPLALEKMLGSGVIALTIVPIALVSDAIDKMDFKGKIKTLKEKKNQKAIEKEEKKEESEESDAIDFFEKIVSDAKSLAIYRPDASSERDKNAMVTGLVHTNAEFGRIAKIASAQGDFVIFYDIDKVHDKSSAEHIPTVYRMFFVNPKTGNYEELAQIKSVRGAKRFAKAWNKKREELEVKKQEREEAKKINAAINQKTRR